MATITTFDEVEQILRQLSPERLRSVVDFINYLYDQERQEATEELERIPGFSEGFERARKQVETGDVVPFEEIRRDV